jgi:hypothetical protein
MNYEKRTKKKGRDDPYKGVFLFQFSAGFQILKTENDADEGDWGPWSGDFLSLGGGGSCANNEGM